ncbi:hypothetical protein ZWY2020_033147 [Hordeum vulgare]|nr:hypothetical protein ZWY2020_033147 [Hordeum vulgare]
MHGKPLRRISNGFPYGVTSESIRHDIHILLDHIHGFYEAALDRLPAETPWRRNIGEEDDYVNVSIISKVRTDMKDRWIFEIPLARDMVDSMTVARQSLEGVVSFLVFQYRYLENTEALRYLRLVGGDLIAVTWLIEQDRSKSLDEAMFNIISPITQIGSRTGRPELLMRVPLSLASQPVKVSKILRAHCGLRPSDVRRLANLLMASIDLAAPRVDDRKKKKKNRKRDDPAPVNTESAGWKPGTHAAFGHTQTLKLLLLGKIHGLYLEALARLPRDGLPKLHNCSLIKGGYCYRPMDPVSNIILNTVWYGTSFPTHPDFEFDFQVDMICTMTLMRIECCSLYGIVAFLRARFSSLTASSCDQCGLMVSHEDGTTATKLSHMLAHRLDDCTVEHLTMLVSKSSPTNSEILNKNQEMLIPAIQKKLKADQEFYVRKVNAAFNRFSLQKGVGYELHIVCGVNPKVTEGSMAYVFKKRLKYDYFHINFWATPKGSNPASTPLVLFFAECSNHDRSEEERPSLCFLVLASIDDKQVLHQHCNDLERIVESSRLRDGPLVVLASILVSVDEATHRDPGRGTSRGSPHGERWWRWPVARTRRRGWLAGVVIVRRQRNGGAD